jgi:hypothetical protein
VQELPGKPGQFIVPPSIFVNVATGIEAPELPDRKYVFCNTFGAEGPEGGLTPRPTADDSMLAFAGKSAHAPATAKTKVRVTANLNTFRLVMQSLLIDLSKFFYGSGLQNR